MEQFQESIKNKDMNHCRSIIIAGLRQEILNKSQFKECLNQALTVFGTNFFDEDDNLNIKNDKKELFASIKVNFSQKKIDQLLDMLPNVDISHEAHHKPQKNSSKSPKMIIILTLVVIAIIIVLYIFMSYSGNNTATNHSTNYSQHIKDQNHE